MTPGSAPPVSSVTRPSMPDERVELCAAALVTPTSIARMTPATRGSDRGGLLNIRPPESRARTVGRGVGAGRGGGRAGLRGAARHANMGARISNSRSHRARYANNSSLTVQYGYRARMPMSSAQPPCPLRRPPSARVRPGPAARLRRRQGLLRRRRPPPHRRRRRRPHRPHPRRRPPLPAHPAGARLRRPRRQSLHAHAAHPRSRLHLPRHRRRRQHRAAVHGAHRPHAARVVLDCACSTAATRSTWRASPPSAS